MPNYPENFKTSTYFYETFHEMTDTVAKNSTKITKLISIIKKISDKNNDVLSSYQMGRQLLINKQDQQAVYDIFDTSEEELSEKILKSPRMYGVGAILSQFTFALPLLLLSGSLYKINKIQISQTVFIFCFFRPWASKCGLFFPLGSNEDCMAYTVNFSLTNKSYLHKFGSIYGVMSESAKSTYDSFIKQLAGIGKIPTDDVIYNSIFYSGIFTRISSLFKGVYSIYLNNLNSKKYLAYDKPVVGGTDKDTGDASLISHQVESDSAVRTKYVQTALYKLTRDPIDEKIARQAVSLALRGSSTPSFENYLLQAVSTINNTRSDDLPRYIDALVGSYLTSYDDTGAKNKASDLTSLKFLAFVKKVFSVHNTLSKDLLDFQRMSEDFLESCSNKYVNFGNTQKARMRVALVMYYAIYVQNANK